MATDGACGTGGMLTVAQARLMKLAAKQGKEVSIHLFGQEINPETYAICKADMLLKGDGEEADHIVYGSTLSYDGNPSRQFDFMLSNIWSPSRISPLRSPMVSRCPLPRFQQICSQMSTAWSDGPVDSWEHICYRFPEGATDLKYPYATYHV